MTRRWSRRCLRPAWLVALLAGAMGPWACGARTELLSGRRVAEETTAQGAGGAGAHGGGDGGGGESGGGGVSDAGVEDVHVDAEPDAGRECIDPRALFVYVVTLQFELYRFDPQALAFTFVGVLDCPSGPNTTPYSMAVDRHGRAFVLFTDGELFLASVFDASCEPTAYQPDQGGFHTFGMGFATAIDEPEDQLFVADADFVEPSKGLGVIDTTTMELTFVGPFTPLLGQRAELTGTGDGKLFAFFLDKPGPGSHVAEVDKASGAITSSVALAVGTPDSAFAFAHWGGDFFLFATDGVNPESTVTRYHPEDGSITDVATLGSTIVGAGVSTCAPR